MSDSEYKQDQLDQLVNEQDNSEVGEQIDRLIQRKQDGDQQNHPIELSQGSAKVKHQFDSEKEKNFKKTKKFLSDVEDDWGPQPQKPARNIKEINAENMKNPIQVYSSSKQVKEQQKEQQKKQLQKKQQQKKAQNGGFFSYFWKDPRKSNLQDFYKKKGGGGSLQPKKQQQKKQQQPKKTHIKQQPKAQNQKQSQKKQNKQSDKKELQKSMKKGYFLDNDFEEYYDYKLSQSEKQKEFSHVPVVNIIQKGVDYLDNIPRRMNRFVQRIGKKPGQYKLSSDQLEVIRKKQRKQLKKQRKQLQEYQNEQYGSKTQNKAILLVSQLEASSKNKQSLQLDFQIKRIIRRRYFSVNAIQQQEKNISSKMFYNPSQRLIQLIRRRIGLDPFAVIHKCSLLKHGDLRVAYSQQQGRNPLLQIQISKISQKIVPWGMFFFDVQKLSHRSVFSQGNSTNVTYNMQQYDCVINIVNMIATLKYKGTQVTPNQMKNRILNQLATQSQVKKAKIVYYQFLKKRGFIG